MIFLDEKTSAGGGSPGLRVWERFRRDGLAKVGAVGMVLLLLVAIFAPALASSRPFVLFVPEGAGGTGFNAIPDGLSFPWLVALFDVRTFPSNVDLFFNGLLVAFPVLLLFLFRRAMRWRGILVWLALGVLLIPLFSHGGRNPDYLGRVQALEQAGADVHAVFPLIPYDPRATDIESIQDSPSSSHLLGTDQAGRDVLARILFGTRISLSIGIVAVSIYVLIGVILGSLAGYMRGWVEAVVLRLVEVVSCFPTFLLVMALIALVHERSIFHVMVVIGLTGWPAVARLVRAEFLSQSDREYAVAARALGFSRARVIFRHLLPNCVAPVTVMAAFGVAGAILVESGLAFLGLGDDSVTSWGQVLRVGRETGLLHLIIPPGILIFVTVTLMNVVAEGIRDAMDPKLDGK